MSSVIIVPVRDRDTHLNCFRLYMREYFPHIPIIVVEQADDNKWNKGLLFNAAYRELAKDYDFIIFHDVDFIPAKTVDYSPTLLPVLLSTECSQFNYGKCYPTFFGGVIGVPKAYYEAIGGFSNNFRGWGGEDDNLLNRFNAAGIMSVSREGNRFENFTHPRDKVEADYQNNLNLLHDLSEGIQSAQYHVSGKTVTHNYTHIKINTLI